jgi:hypothetical protein
MTNSALAVTQPFVGYASPIAPSIEIAPTRAQRRSRPRVAYAVVVVGGLGAVLAGQLLLSIALSDGAYVIDGLQSKQTALARSEQLLSEDLDKLSSPQNLARNAESLGMVQNANPAYLRLSDGAVLGAPAAAQGSNGTVLGAGGSLVANQLLVNVPLATQIAQQKSDAAAAATAAAAAVVAAAQTAVTTTPAVATPVVAAAATGAAQVPSQGALAAPDTH